MSTEVEIKKGWIGVDLDGTLAYYNGLENTFSIGDPIPLMLERVKKWRENGIEVRIFTARVDGVPDPSLFEDKAAVLFYQNIDNVVKMIQDWTEKHLGERLTVTCKKDFSMMQLWDDKCKQVIKNTGEAIEDHYNELLYRC